jgi:hypothetical protein
MRNLGGGFAFLLFMSTAIKKLKNIFNQWLKKTEKIKRQFIVKMADWFIITIITCAEDMSFVVETKVRMQKYA